MTDEKVVEEFDAKGRFTEGTYDIALERDFDTIFVTSLKVSADGKCRLVCHKIGGDKEVCFPVILGHIEEEVKDYANDKNTFVNLENFHTLCLIAGFNDFDEDFKTENLVEGEGCQL